MNFDKELEAFRQKWNASKKNVSASRGYQEYMAFKYELLCKRVNEYNINK